MVEFLTDLISEWHIGLQIAIFVVGLALGTFCLVKFCDFFVDSSSVIAKKLKISPLIIGLTIVAMGTSLPELAVSVSDSISNIGGGSAELAIGNVIGSNIANILLVLGFSVVFTPIVVKKGICKHELPILLGVTGVTVLFVCLFGMTSTASDFAITRWEGIILIVLIAAYITYLVLMAKKHPEQLDDAETEVAKDMPWWKAILLLIVGAAGIILGGQFVVFGAKGIAINGAVALGADEGLTKSLVGLTIVAVGTSLPELVTSTIAAKKGQNELALGNVIGSNIFNSLFVLGISATVNPLTTDSQVLIDAFFMLGITVMLFVFALSGKLRKAHGFVLLGCYVFYLTYLILRTVLGWSF
ncbi:MAG: calcium/sodium antiporter [Clostridiales bacterium]|nr:calcium/sodium antiporter [Clostridiales bacterium]